MSTSICSNQPESEAASVKISDAGLTPSSEHHSVYCPTCSSRLYSRRCKLICASCGYYLSCADYY